MKNKRNEIYHFQYKSFFSGVFIGFLAMIVFLKKNKNLSPEKTMKDKSLETQKEGIDDEPLHSSSSHTGG